MSKIKRWVRNWLKNDSALLEYHISKESQAGNALMPDSDKSLQFKIWFANGGRVVQTNRYDQPHDRHHVNMYVIHNEQNFGEQIDKIIIMEGLRG